MDRNFTDIRNTYGGLSALPEELRAILRARGIDTDDKARVFLYPAAEDLASPYILDGTAEAVQIINSHIAKGSRITVFGDYDCDGIGAAAILYLTLKDMGADISVFIPARLEDGYGLSQATLEKVIEKNSPNLIITVDCGISSPDEIKYAKNSGIDVIITDHHEPQSVVPDCCVINPKLQKGVCEYCGAGVVFKLVEALKGRQYALQYIDICAISTIADLVPLKGENRIIARLGLEKLSSLNPRPGIKALFNVAGMRAYGQKLTSYDVAFKIAPRLNASGRLSNAEKSFKLLVETDPTLLSLIANELEAENRQRQELCQQTIDEAKEMLKSYDLINNRVIVLCKDSWEGGVIGIAAAKLAQDYYRPTILFTRREGILKGSCRSISGISIYDVLNACKDKIDRFGGHSMAAGLSILPEKLEEFTAAVNDYVAKTYPDSLFFDYTHYDIEIDIKKVNAVFARALSCFEPYGCENPMPTFMYRAKAVPFKRIGVYNHIKYAANKECELVAFNYFDRADILVSEMEKRLFFTVEYEIFRNDEKAKCYLKAFTIENIAPKEEAMLLDYLRALLPENRLSPKKAVCKPSALYGHLIVTYDKHTFDSLCQRYPSYKRAYRYLDTSNPYNTVLLSPAGDINTDNYCVVEVYDDIYGEVAAASVTDSQSPCLKFDIDIAKPDINCVREIYLFLLTSQNGQKYFGADDLYNRFIAAGYARSRLTFELSCLALREMKLLSFNNNSIIVNKHKADIAKSRVLNSLERICRLS